MKMLAAYLLAVVPLALAESASGLSHVVRVGRNGRQVVHQAGQLGGGAKLGRKVRRKGRNTLSQPALATRLAPAPAPQPQVFAAHPTHQHVIHDIQPAFHAAPAAFAHHHVPHAPTNLFHFSHHSPAIDHNLHHPAVHHTAPLPVAPVQIAAAPAHFSFHPAPFPVAPLPVAPLPLAPAPAPLPLAPVQVAAAPAPAEDLPEILAIGRDAPEAVAPEVAAPAALYGAPEVAAPAALYGAPEVAAPAALYGAPEPAVPEATEAPVVVEVAKAAELYGAPEPEVTEAPVVVEAAADSYLAAAPAPAPLPVPAPAPAPLPVPAPAPVAPAVVVEVAREAPANSYIAAAPSAPIAVVKSDVLAATRAEPIAIVRSVLNAPDTLLAAKDGWDYSYEAANGIKQEATGSLKLVDDTAVSVMRGSYEFVGADGIVYAVEWRADETGFHATAPHLPRSVLPNHPEVAAAVKAQIAFAETEQQQAASGVIEARAPLTSYGALPGYTY